MPIYVQTSSGAKSEVTDLRLQQDSGRVQPEAVFAQVNATQRAVVWAPKQRFGTRDHYISTATSTPVGIHRHFGDSRIDRSNALFCLSVEVDSSRSRREDPRRLYLLGQRDGENRMFLAKPLYLTSIGLTPTDVLDANDDWGFCRLPNTSHFFAVSKSLSLYIRSSRSHAEIPLSNHGTLASLGNTFFAWDLATDGTSLYVLIGDESGTNNSRIYKVGIPSTSTRDFTILSWTLLTNSVPRLTKTFRSDATPQERATGNFRASMSLWNSRLVVYVGNTLYQYSTTNGSLLGTTLLGGIFDFSSFLRTSPIESQGMDITTSTIYIRSSASYLNYVFSYPNIL